MQNSIRFPHLLKADIFDGLDSGFKKDFLNACHMVTYAQPSVIYEQGEAASEVMILARGHVDVTYLGEGGIEMFIIRLGEGTAIAEMEVVSELPCLATCKTAVNTILLSCPRKQLDIALQQPAFLKNMIRAFYQRLTYVNWSKYLAQFGSVEDRLKGYLYVLSERGSDIRDSQAYLARMIGCSRQTINRELGVLKDAGLIGVSGGAITVLNREGLVA